MLTGIGLDGIELVSLCLFGSFASLCTGSLDRVTTSRVPLIIKAICHSLCTTFDCIVTSSGPKAQI